MMRHAPAKKMAYPSLGSADALTSGTSRQSVPPVALHGAPLLPLTLPSAVCQEGIGQFAETPPPPALTVVPPLPSGTMPLFQVVSVPTDVGSVVPPTPVTNG